MPEILELPFFAGVDDEQQPVFESLRVEIVDARRDIIRLMHSPVLARNLAAGDKLKVINAATAEYELEKRSGNLCLRVFRRQDIDSLDEQLTPALEKLGGQLDVKTDRALIYSIHFSIGFKQIEELLNKHCAQHPGAVWYYGNVYDPDEGVTPLRWWEEFESLE